MSDLNELFYRDTYAREFTADVVSCTEGQNGFEVVLSDTAFYPEGGGQPADRGKLDDAVVTDVKRVSGIIVHCTDKTLAVGSTVKGVLDWSRRYDNMQNHTGEHVISGLIHKKYGFDNVGFHMDEDVITVDFDGVIPANELLAIEQQVNDAIYADIPVNVLFPSAEELKAMDYRSKKELTGQVRIVTIPGADICACCGTHVSNTGEIGLIKIFSCVKFHDGVRLELLCGRRALAYLSEIAEQNRRVSGLLSAKPLETAAAVQRLLDAEAAQKQRAAGLEEAVFAQKAQALMGKGNVLLFEPAMSPDSLRRLTDLVMSACGGRAAIFAGSDAEGYKYAVGEQNGDLRQLVKDLNAQLHGRGGGKPFFVQGSVQTGRAEIEAFFAGR